MTYPLPEKLPPGLYETLVTGELKRRIEASRSAGGKALEQDLDSADGHELLARHLFDALRRSLRELPQEERAERQAELVNLLLCQLGAADLAVLVPPKVLESVVEGAGPGSQGLERPEVPLSQSDLLVNARGEPGVGRALEREIDSADRIDLLCAFIRWPGLRVLLDALRRHRERGRSLRIITSTYTGSTERVRARCPTRFWVPVATRATPASAPWLSSGVSPAISRRTCTPLPAWRRDRLEETRP